MFEKIQHRFSFGGRVKIFGAEWKYLGAEWKCISNFERGAINAHQQSRVKSNRSANLVNLRLIRIDGRSSFAPWTNRLRRKKQNQCRNEIKWGGLTGIYRQCRCGSAVVRWLRRIRWLIALFLLPSFAGCPSTHCWQPDQPSLPLNTSKSTIPNMDTDRLVKIPANALHA